MTTQPAGRSGADEQSAFHRDHDIIHLGGEAAVVVPVDEYRRLRALESLASPQELEGAEAAAALYEYREWSAAGRPGAVPHAEARKLLPGEDGEYRMAGWSRTLVAGLPGADAGLVAFGIGQDPESGGFGVIDQGPARG